MSNGVAGCNCAECRYERGEDAEDSDFYLGEVVSTSCCGLGDYSGLDDLTEKGAVSIYEDAASMDFGYVIATAVIPSQKAAIPKLLKAGFKELARFTNPKTKNRIVLFGRGTGTKTRKKAA